MAVDFAVDHLKSDKNALPLTVHLNGPKNRHFNLPIFIIDNLFSVRNVL